MMTYPSWPVSLPQSPLLQSLTGGPQESRVSFQPDSGPPIERPRSTAEAEIWSVSFNMTKDQLAVFKTFWRNDLSMGTQPFAWWHPLTGEVGRWRILGGTPPYSISAVSTQDFTVSFQAMLLPGETWFAPYLPAGTLLVPDLVVDFVSQIYGVFGVRKTFSDLITFSRPGPGNYVDKFGVTQTAPPNAPRFGHDFVTLAPLGLLLDESEGDDASIRPARWPSGLLSSGGTIVVVCRSNDVSTIGYHNAFSAKNPSWSDRVEVLVRQDLSAFRLRVNDAFVVNTNLGSYTPGARAKVAAAYDASDARVSRDGGPIINNPSGSIPDVNQADFGVGQDRIWIERVICWNAVLNNPQLQDLSS